MGFPKVLAHFRRVLCYDFCCDYCGFCCVFLRLNLLHFHLLGVLLLADLQAFLSALLARFR